MSLVPRLALSNQSSDRTSTCNHLFNQASLLLYCLSHCDYQFVINYAEVSGFLYRHWLDLGAKCCSAFHSSRTPRHHNNKNGKANYSRTRRTVGCSKGLQSKLTSCRSSLGGHTATVFGATGFLGRYIVNRLANKGCTVIVPFREEMAKRHLKVTGDLGRVQFLV